ncbi:hypothetical protein BD770DRAFT_398920 [Pilaira anomala]|nr:hypothetical protein BD770DRAFT_398920 [Pilaira anomala]
MKDMLFNLCSKAPSLQNELYLPGFLIMNMKLTMVTMDRPVGYICRIKSADYIPFPSLPPK